jgi:hypothetical protein
MAKRKLSIFSGGRVALNIHLVLLNSYLLPLEYPRKFSHQVDYMTESLGLDLIVRAHQVVQDG